MSSYVLLFVILTLFGAFGGYCFKRAISKSDTIIKVIFQPYLYLGGMLYVLGALLNIIVLKKYSYSVVLPITSLTYIWTMLISRYLLKENITRKKSLGVVLIIIGAVILGLLE